MPDIEADAQKPASELATKRPGHTHTEHIGKGVMFMMLGSMLFAIADALGKSVNSIRGKALSLLRSGDINAIPKQKETKGSSKVDPLADIENIGDLTVEAIADDIGKTVRGVKTMLTRRGLTCADYDGAARKEKASS